MMRAGPSGYDLSAVVVLLVLVSARPGRAEGVHGTGVEGIVRDHVTRDPVVEASVVVVSGGEGSTVTDERGRYRLRIGPGVYEIRVRHELYRTCRVRRIVVDRGRTTRVDVDMDPDDSAVLEFVVAARADTRKEEALLQIRKRAGSVSDAVSSEEIARTPDSSASDAVKRIMATSLVDGRYAAIRGLGGRYTATLVNRVTLPSPDPDEPAFPLDLLPAGLLANLSVVKTHTADLPATFGGGALLIETNAFPIAFESKVKLGLGFDSSSTFRRMNTYGGGRVDFLGFDDGTRALPAVLPAGVPLVQGSGGVDASVAEAAGEAFRDEWSATTRRAFPNLDVAGTVGDTVPVGRRARLGYLVSLQYAHKDRVREADVAKATLETSGEGAGGADPHGDRETAIREQARVVTGLQTARLGALADVGLQIDPSNEIEVLSLFIRDADKVAQTASGYNETDAQDFTSTRLQFIARTLSFTQIRGRHLLSSASGLELRWMGHFSFVQRDEPDTRDIKYHVLDDGRMRFAQGPGSAERLFIGLRDLSGGGGIDVTWPFRPVHFLAGAAVQWSSRDLDSRRFRFDAVGGDLSVLFLPPEEMLSPAHIGPTFRLKERTLHSDAYGASLLVAAAYVAADIVATKPVRLTPGLRFEHSRQHLRSGTAYSVAEFTEPGVDRTHSAWVPSLNAVWAIRPDMNLRLGYAWTLARPQFRELAPFAYYDFTRRRTVSGNPDLGMTRIHGADLRWEWFPTTDSVVAAGGFYKVFRHPIERVVLAASQGDVGFDNAPGAWLVGVEVEARTNLAWVSRALREFRFLANAAVIRSRVTFPHDQATLQTSRERPLQGQSPYVVNLGLGWRGERTGTEVTVLYNVSGPRISEVGFDRLPDVYEEPVHRLDLTASQELGMGFRLRLALSNLAFQAVRVRQGSVTVYQDQPGVSGSLSVDWSFKSRRDEAEASNTPGGTAP